MKAGNPESSIKIEVTRFASPRYFIEGQLYSYIKYQIMKKLKNGIRLDDLLKCRVEHWSSGNVVKSKEVWKHLVALKLWHKIETGHPGNSNCFLTADGLEILTILEAKDWQVPERKQLDFDFNKRKPPDANVITASFREKIIDLLAAATRSPALMRKEVKQPPVYHIVCPKCGIKPVDVHDDDLDISYLRCEQCNRVWVTPETEDDCY